MPKRGPTIAETVLDLIRDCGPLTLDALAPMVVAAGRTKAKDPRSAVVGAIGSDPDFIEGMDGRWHSIATQLDGALFTVRLSSLERREGIVLVRNDLTLLERLLTRHGRPFAGGGDVHLDFLADYLGLPWPGEDVGEDGLEDALAADTATLLLGFMEELGVPPGDDAQNLDDLRWETRDTRILHGPAGWLPAMGPRQLLGIRVANGTLQTRTFDRRSLSGEHLGAAGRRVAQLAGRVIGPDPSWFGPPVIMVEELLEIVATEAPELFRQPLPPFTEVVRRGGLEVEEGLVGHAGTNWDEVRWALAPDPEDAWGFEPPDVVH